MNEMLRQHFQYKEVIGEIKLSAPFIKIKDNLLYDTELHEMVDYFGGLLQMIM